QPAGAAAGLAGADPAECDSGRFRPQLRRGLGDPPAGGPGPAVVRPAGGPAGCRRGAPVGHAPHPVLMRRPTATPGSAAARIAAWQHRAGRHGLPWQGTRDPYRIWLSEIMLQQTQAATVVPYYTRFLDLFPTVIDLADA